MASKWRYMGNGEAQVLADLLEEVQQHWVTNSSMGVKIGFELSKHRLPQEEEPLKLMAGGDEFSIAINALRKDMAALKKEVRG